MTNKDFSRALGRALHRPAFAPVPGFAVRALYGEMADIVVNGQRAVPERPLALGFRSRHPELDEALRERAGAADRSGILVYLQEPAHATAEHRVAWSP